MSTETRPSLPPSYFEALYAADPDPWRFATSDYEAAKYAATLGALARTRYDAGLEIGCSIGVLTTQLARRCTSLLAIDVSTQALESARARCAEQPHVRFARMQMPQEFPDERFDLVVVSEVGYYLSWEDLGRAQRQIMQALTPGGSLLLVHWTLETNYPLTGDEVHDSFQALEGLGHRHGRREQRYRLDLFERV